MLDRHLVVIAFAASLAAPAVAEPSPRPAEAETGSAGDQAFLDAMREMTVEMRRNVPSGDVDQDFVRLSVTQRQAAIAMAKAELKFGKDDRLKALAKEIVTSQEKEIALMKAWEDKRRGGH